jgi:hypothetical protein
MQAATDPECPNKLSWYPPPLAQTYTILMQLQLKKTLEELELAETKNTI